MTKLMMPSKVSMWGLALNASFEKQADGMTHLIAYQDPLGIWTIGDGITEYPDGTPVKKGDRLTEKQAKVLNQRTMAKFAKAVRDNVTVDLEQHQFDALAVFAYNIGIGGFKSSTVLEYVNKNRFEDAARHFGDWLYGTVKSVEGEGGKVIYRTGPDGEPLELGVEWKRALRGLLRRHYSSALLFLGYDWSIAAAEDEIELETEHEWFPDYENADGVVVGRWKDKVIPAGTTQFEDVYRVARAYPLDLEAKGVEKVMEVPLPKKEISKNSIDVPVIADGQKVKFLEDSERFIGQMLISIGVVMRSASKNIAALGGATTGMFALAADLLGNSATLALITMAIIGLMSWLIWFGGWLSEKRGTKIKARGRATATQALW